MCNEQKTKSSVPFYYKQAQYLQSDIIVVMKKLKIEDLPNHHAILIVSSERDYIANDFWANISDNSVPNRFFNQTVLDIDTVRELISWSNNSFASDKKAIISFHTITVPAQNAMLKVLEDPKDGVSFILITSNKNSLLPTVISRLHEIKIQDTRYKIQDEVEEFFGTKQTERMKLKLVTNLLAKEDEMGRKDREAVRDFISSLINYGRQNNLESNKLKKLIEMESYASDPSASGKMLFELISLYLPVIKK